jgi:hypothetical protein
MEQCNGLPAHRKVFFDEINIETAARRPCESGKEDENSPTPKQSKRVLSRRSRPINDCATNIEALEETISEKSARWDGHSENQKFRKNESSMAKTSCFSGLEGSYFASDGDRHAVKQRISQNISQPKPSYRTRLRTIGK